MKRIGLVTGLACAAGMAFSGTSGPATADEWSDPAKTAVEAFLARRDAAREGRESTAWVTKRHDEVAVFADLARVDVTLDVSNGGTAQGRGLEWRRTLPIDASAELIGAVYTRADGATTPAQTLAGADARRLYGEATNPNFGRDPLWITREEKDLLDVTIFPVQPGTTVRVVLSFVTPLRGRGERLEYRDPLGVRAIPRPTTEPTEAPPSAPPVPIPASAPAAVRAQLARAMREASLPAAAVRVPAKLVVVTFSGVLPDAPPEGVTWTTRADGAWCIEPGTDGELPPLPVRSIRGAAPAQVFQAQGYPIATSAFAWRADPAALLAAMDIEPATGIEIRLDGIVGVTSRVAPDVLAADSEPTVVMGRAYASTSIRLRLHAVGPDGKTIGGRELDIPGARTTPREAVADALKAWHRARLADRVERWAGLRADRRQLALAYAVDLGVLRSGTAALAIPKDERGWLSRADLKLYLTDGAPFDGDSSQGDFKTPPSGSVR